jgi:hypothetical protein
MIGSELMQAAPAQLRDFAARYTAAWCSQDPTSVAGFYSRGGSLAVNNDVLAAGRNAIAEVAQSFMTAFPDMPLIMDEVLMQRDRVEYHWTCAPNHNQERTAGVGTISCLVLQKGKKEIPASFPTSGWRRALIRTPNGKKR